MQDGKRFASRHVRGMQAGDAPGKRRVVLDAQVSFAVPMEGPQHTTPSRAATIDPAAQTEVSKFCKETGFTLIDPDEGLKGKADILIVGEAFSETATRQGNLISVKARVPIDALPGVFHDLLSGGAWAQVASRYPVTK